MKVDVVAGRGTTDELVYFNPPSRTTDWVLIFRTGSN